MMVMFFHLGKAIADEKYFAIDGFAQPFAFAGGAGVDFFFVLSGFIIFYVHQADISQPHRLGNYVRKRLSRIYPTYLIIFFAVYLLALALPSTRSAVPHDFWLILQASLLIPLDVDIVGGTGAPVIIAAWSLQYEMLFYALFALAIIDRRLGIAAAVGVSIIVVTGLFVDDLSFPLSFIAQDVVLLFMLGMLGAWVCSNLKLSKRFSATSFYLGATLFVFAALDINLGAFLMSDWSNYAFGIASTLIVIGMVGLEDHGKKVMASPWLQTVGAASYALYLLHYPVISVLCKTAMLLNLPSYGLLGASLTYLAIASTCIALSVLFYHYIERPTARALSRLSR